MSANAYDLGLRLRAMETGSPVARSSCAHFRLRRNADVVAVATMTGEPDAVWGIAYGQWSSQRAASFAEAVADPRSFADQVDLFSRFGRKLKAVHDLQPEGWFPQVVVSSAPAWQHLHAASSRLARVEDLDARYAAEMFLWASERMEHPGSQAVTVLSALFGGHWTAPAPADEDELLDTWLSAFSREMARYGRPITRSRDDHPDDARTTPAFDEEVRKPLAAMARARTQGRPEQAKALAHSIPPRVLKVVRDRFSRAAHLLRAYEALAPAPLAGIDALTEDDLYTWKRFRDSRERGFRVARQDRFKDAVMGLRSREQAAEAWERLLIYGDALVRQRAVHDGRAVDGTVAAAGNAEFTVRTLQPMLRFRTGTKVAAVGHPHLDGEIVALGIAGSDATHLRVRLAKPTLEVASLAQPIMLVEPPPDFGMMKRSQGNALGRMKSLGWIHDLDQDPPPSLNRPVPADVLGRAQWLRAL